MNGNSRQDQPEENPGQTFSLLETHKEDRQTPNTICTAKSQASSLKEEDVVSPRVTHMLLQHHQLRIRRDKRKRHTFSYPSLSLSFPPFPLHPSSLLFLTTKEMISKVTRDQDRTSLIVLKDERG